MYEYHVLPFLILESKYKEIIYSMDVWHKSKSIKKCLAKVSMLQYVSILKQY